MQLLRILAASFISTRKVDSPLAKLSEAPTRVNNEVKELRSNFLDGRSRLMRLKMESAVIAKMKEKGLAPSVIPPKKIKVKSQN